MITVTSQTVMLHGLGAGKCNDYAVKEGALHGRCMMSRSGFVLHIVSCLIVPTTFLRCLRHQMVKACCCQYSMSSCNCRDPAAQCQVTHMQNGRLTTKCGASTTLTSWCKLVGCDPYSSVCMHVRQAVGESVASCQYEHAPAAHGLSACQSPSKKERCPWPCA